MIFCDTTGKECKMNNCYSCAGCDIYKEKHMIKGTAIVDGRKATIEPVEVQHMQIDPSKFNVTESGQVVKEDIIGHPSHYCEGRKYEPKDVIRDWDLNFNLGNAVKYISRNGRKDGNSALQDLKKARQYLDFEIAYLEKEDK